MYNEYKKELTDRKYSFEAHQELHKLFLSIEYLELERDNYSPDQYLVNWRKILKDIKVIHAENFGKLAVPLSVHFLKNLGYSIQSAKDFVLVSSTGLIFDETDLVIEKEDLPIITDAVYMFHKISNYFKHPYDI